MGMQTLQRDATDNSRPGPEGPLRRLAGSPSTQFLGFTLAFTSLLGGSKSNSSLQTTDSRPSASSTLDEETIAIPLSAFEVLEEPSSETQARWQEVSKKLENGEVGIREELTRSVESQYREELTLRARRTGLGERMDRVEESIRSSTADFQNHPYSNEEWKDYLSDFVEETSPHWNVCVKNPNEVGYHAFRSSLRSLEKALNPFEDYLGITPPSSRHFSTETSLLILERLKRSEGVNTRRTALHAELDSRIRRAPYRSDERIAFQRQKNELSKNWNALVASFGRSFG